jgi:PHD/YefM family antitoxin component YafN of YafNO toxin-antitoxin module
MGRTMTLQDASRDFATLVTTIDPTNETVIIDENGTALAVVLSFEEFQELSRERAWAIIRQVQERNADKDPDEILREVTEIVEEVRQEQYDRERAATANRS